MTCLQKNSMMLATGMSFSLALACGQALAQDIPQLDCVIEPHMVVDLSSQIDGIVDSISVERGPARKRTRSFAPAR
jgi:hypothetical protein